MTAACALAGFVLAVVGLSPVAAQVGPPTRLGPPPALPSGTLQPPGSIGGPAAQPASDAPHAPEGIVADSLAPPDAAAAGALGSDDRALPATLWDGVDRGLVLNLLPRVTAGASPALNDLAFRLLASPVKPPAAGDSGSGSGSAFLALRAERLANGLGRSDAAAALLSVAAAGGGDPTMQRVAVDLAFLSGNTQSACATVAARNGAWTDAFWDEAAATCAILNVNQADARLSLDLLHEGKTRDDAFLSLAEAVLANAAKPPAALPVPKALSIALLAKAGVPIGRKLLDTADPAIARAIAMDPGFPADIRLDAAEAAAIHGAITPDKLAEAYLAAPLDEDDREQPLNRAAASPGSKGRAILVSAARDAAAPTARANFLALLLAGAGRGDLYLVLARSVAPLILAVPPTPEAAASAPEFARALYAAGRAPEAAQWLAVASADDAAALLPLARIAAGDAAPAWDGRSLIELAHRVTKDGAPQRRALLVAGLLAALGDDKAAPVLAALSDLKAPAPASPAPDMLIAVEAAGHHMGGAVLAALAAIGDQGPAAPFATLVESVAALRAVGLVDDAHRVATDAAIAAGL